MKLIQLLREIKIEKHTNIKNPLFEVSIDDKGNLQGFSFPRDKDTPAYKKLGRYMTTVKPNPQITQKYGKKPKIKANILHNILVLITDELQKSNHLSNTKDFNHGTFLWALFNTFKPMEYKTFTPSIAYRMIEAYMLLLEFNTSDPLLENALKLSIERSMSSLNQ